MVVVSERLGDACSGRGVGVQRPAEAWHQGILGSALGSHGCVGGTGRRHVQHLPQQQRRPLLAARIPRLQGRHQPLPRICSLGLYSMRCFRSFTCALPSKAIAKSITAMSGAFCCPIKSLERLSYRVRHPQTERTAALFNRVYPEPQSARAAHLDNVPLVGWICGQPCEGLRGCKRGGRGSVRGCELLQEAGDRAGASAHKVVAPLLPRARHQRLKRTPVQ